jgi:hypothetical protein
MKCRRCEAPDGLHEHWCLCITEMGDPPPRPRLAPHAPHFRWDYQYKCWYLCEVHKGHFDIYTAFVMGAIVR